MKKCNNCNEEKPLEEFVNDRSSKTGKHTYCRICMRTKNKERYEKDKPVKKKYIEDNWDVISQRGKDNYLLNREKKKIISKNYYINNKETHDIRTQKYTKNKYHTDPIFRLTHNLRSSIITNLKRYISNSSCKSRKTKDILGCTFKEFKQYIELLFKDWMNWDNHGLYNGELDYGWDLDHIIPISSAKTEEDIYRLSHYTNFQPLCSKINRDIKINKLNFK